MNQSDDRVFIRKFSGIILGLIAFTAIILALAFSLRSTPDPEANPSQVRLAEERIAPVAGVHTGAEGEAAAAAAQTAAAATDTATTPAANPSAAAGGEQIYQAVCTACHTAGVAGAPMPGSAVMQERLAAKGLDGLVSSAINGLNVMPPKGGRPDISDADIRAAVEFMLK